MEHQNLTWVWQDYTNDGLQSHLLHLIPNCNKTNLQLSGRVWYVDSVLWIRYCFNTLPKLCVYATHIICNCDICNTPLGLRSLLLIRKVTSSRSGVNGNIQRSINRNRKIIRQGHTDLSSKPPVWHLINKVRGRRKIYLFLRFLVQSLVGYSNLMR